MLQIVININVLLLKMYTTNNFKTEFIPYYNLYIFSIQVGIVEDMHY